MEQTTGHYDNGIESLPDLLRKLLELGLEILVEESRLRVCLAKAKFECIKKRIEEQRVINDIYIKMLERAISR